MIETTEETEFKVTVEQLERAKTPRTKVLLFVSPDNPSGWQVEMGNVGRLGPEFNANTNLPGTTGTTEEEE